ncbi:hypothetical protein [Terribacillus saccharophilus]|uniref:Uncharacterized protein n=1 Tax=Terribacillus saccharophilus TaxID=361277 RepID=A0ABX4GZF6_9BACI|nr:hypothetical protein [Terribacillus saccharophilus]PAD36278.1 hypothetical protein CHH56_05120 [Terribacillus saccharophilus]PAD96682.1 hypothetical protein CHH50_07190 [Terribacillus saccharophilus]PAE00258.1 hypothetical protein CHH48_08095 [Terribacillus saccharophilus]
MKIMHYTILLFCLVFLFACSEEEVVTIGNPTAEEILLMEEDADILQHNGTVYQTGMDWLDEEDVTKKEKVGQIKKSSTDGISFEDGTATHLPVGTSIYSINENGSILLAEVDGELIRYAVLAEG